MFFSLLSCSDAVGFSGGIQPLEWGRREVGFPKELNFCISPSCYNPNESLPFSWEFVTPLGFLATGHLLQVPLEHFDFS